MIGRCGERGVRIVVGHMQEALAETTVCDNVEHDSDGGHWLTLKKSLADGEDVPSVDDEQGRRTRRAWMAALPVKWCICVDSLLVATITLRFERLNPHVAPGISRAIYGSSLAWLAVS